jgi:hypothetical protein
MTDRPIIFSGEMVRAILADRKTQTRRVIKPQFNHKFGSGVPHGYDRFGVHVDIALIEPHPMFGGWAYLFCPYGKAGDRLWVRETWGVLGTSVCYRAYGEFTQDDRDLGYTCKWRPSIFMFRDLSRITLEIVSIQAERLQDISEQDAIAEGIEQKEPNHVVGARYRFGQLWNSINRKRGFGWEVNPWVWVIEFKRIEVPK